MPFKQPPLLTKFLKDFSWKTATVELAGEKHSVAVFDWTQLCIDEDKVIAEIQKRPEEEHESAFSHAKLWTSDFYAYFVDDNAEAKVEEGNWFPIAVIGMGDAETIESFQEMNNDGFLAFVVKDQEFETGTIIWYRQDDEDQSLHVAAPSVAGLKIRLAEAGK
jgi:hypothetical protein